MPTLVALLKYASVAALASLNKLAWPRKPLWVDWRGHAGFFGYVGVAAGAPITHAGIIKSASGWLAWARYSVRLRSMWKFPKRSNALLIGHPRFSYSQDCNLRKPLLLLDLFESSIFFCPSLLLALLPHLLHVMHCPLRNNHNAK